MTPRSPGTKPEKMKNSDNTVRKVPNLAGVDDENPSI
jgi:hypothetical protein